MNGVLRALLTERIDYAGLFPPAAHDMATAVANYAGYRESGDAWALSRFIVPVARLDEFERAASPYLRGAPWRLSALAQAGDGAAIRSFNDRMTGRACIDVVETRAGTAAEVEACAPLAAFGAVYVELPARDDPDALIAAVAACGLRAKIRTGGVTVDAFPSAAQVARFLVTCARRGTMMKATAGLHHPLRGNYPLTYAEQAPRGVMFGYLNVVIAASFARRGASAEELVSLLEERSIRAFVTEGDVLQWGERTLTAEQLAEDREQFVTSFGSCSFREPLDDLQPLVPS